MEKVLTLLNILKGLTEWTYMIINNYHITAGVILVVRSIMSFNGMQLDPMWDILCMSLIGIKLVIVFKK